MKRLSTLLIVLAQCYCVAAQQQYPHFTQTYSNPYLINPSFITLENSVEINASYRQNWVKVSEAPSSMQFDVQYPIDPKISLGLNVYNDKSILLSQTAALATFGYKIDVAPFHFLGFGLSAGAVFNQLNRNNIPDVDLADPAVANISNNTNFTGQFGINYQYKRWMLGFSLMDLVENSPFLNDELVNSEKFTPFRDKAVYISTRFNVARSIQAQPVFVYRMTNTDTEFFEGNLLFSFKNHVDIGGGYRSDFGPQVLLRVRISKVRIGYAYQLPASGTNSSFGGTNEFQGKILFKDFFEPTAEKKTTTPNTNTPIVTTTEVPKENPIIPKDTAREEDKQPAPVVTPPVEEPKPSVQEPAVAEEPAAPAVMYKVVIGVFSSQEHAEGFLKKVQTMGYNAILLKPEGSRYYYIHLPDYESPERRYETILEIREKTGFADAWYKQF